MTLCRRNRKSLRSYQLFRTRRIVYKWPKRKCLRQSRETFFLCGLSKLGSRLCSLLAVVSSRPFYTVTVYCCVLSSFYLHAARHTLVKWAVHYDSERKVRWHLVVGQRSRTIGFLTTVWPSTTVQEFERQLHVNTALRWLFRHTTWCDKIWKGPNFAGMRSAWRLLS